MPIRIRNHLQAIRKRQGWTQNQLAHMFGVTRKTIWHWEHQETLPKLEIVMGLAKVFDTEVHLMFEPVEEKGDNEDELS